MYSIAIGKSTDCFILTVSFLHLYCMTTTSLQKHVLRKYLEQIITCGQAMVSAQLTKLSSPVSPQLILINSRHLSQSLDTPFL